MDILELPYKRMKRGPKQDPLTPTPTLNPNPNPSTQASQHVLPDLTNQFAYYWHYQKKNLVQASIPFKMIKNAILNLWHTFVFLSHTYPTQIQQLTIILGFVLTTNASHTSFNAFGTHVKAP
jgi:hypothetical protein